MRVLLVSPYHGGSHAAWALGLQRCSTHDIELLTLPDRFWKWRMHGGAATLARRFLRACEDGDAPPDVILATDMLDLSTFLALTRSVTASTPAVLYMHENQLTYPLPADADKGPMRRQLGERDQHYAFINFASMLAADRVVFNSSFHHDAWFTELPPFLRHFPEYNELGSIDGLRAKSSVLPVGIDIGDPPSGAAPAAPADGAHPRTGVSPAEGPDSAHAADHDATDPPLVIWNQRWEYDKNPAELVDALREVAARGIDFRLAICGQSYSKASSALEGARSSLRNQLIHFGFAEADHYRRLLAAADITLSTAHHEFFGIGVLEAMAHGAFAVLPDRLNYPALVQGDDISDATRQRCLYGSHEELVDKLSWALQDIDAARTAGRELQGNARRFAWPRVAPAYDELLNEVNQALPCGNSTLRPQ